MEIVIFIIVIGALFFIFGWVSNNRPITEWSNEKLRTMYPKLLKAARSQANPVKRDEYDVKAEEVWNEMQKRVEKHNNTIKKTDTSSDLEKELISYANNWLSAFGVDDKHCKDIVNKAKINAQKYVENYSLDDIYTKSFGDTIIKSETYLDSRKEYGLSKDDIQKYWNKGLWFRLLEQEIREMMFYLHMSKMTTAGDSDLDAAKKYYLYSPSYGNPKKWDKSLPLNEGLTTKDAYLPQELSDRIQKWMENIGEVELAKLVVLNSSFNSLVRSLIYKKEL